MSRPDDIPQDVWEAALAVQDRAIDRCEAGKLAYRFPTCNGKAVLDEEVARAILAERERCAKVLEENHTVICGEPADPMMFELIDAIRSGTQP